MPTSHSAAPEPLLRSVESWWLNQSEALGPDRLDPLVALLLVPGIRALANMSYQMGRQDSGGIAPTAIRAGDLQLSQVDADLIKKTEEDPFIPDFPELQDRPDAQEECERIWMDTMARVLFAAKRLNKCNANKRYIDSLLKPFCQ